MDSQENVSLKADFEAFREFLEQGNTLAAIDQFYDDTIVQVENTDEPMVGKALLRANEAANLERIDALALTIIDYVVDEKRGLVWGQMSISFTSINKRKKKLTEAFKQH